MLNKCRHAFRSPASLRSIQPGNTVVCRLKKTSPTAYCDCWEKCKCRSLIAGNQASRYELLNRILTETDLVKLSNSRLDLILCLLPAVNLSVLCGSDILFLVVVNC